MKKDIEQKILSSSKKGYDSMLIDFVKQIVCSYYGVEVDLLKYTTRKRRVVKCRQVSIYLISKHSQATLMFIASEFAKDHATVIHSKKVVEDQMAWDKELRKEVDELDKIISLKAHAIVNNFSLEKKFYYIDMNDFVSLKLNKKQSVIFTGFTDEEVKQFCVKSSIFEEPRKHVNKGMYVLEKYTDEDNKDKS